MKATLFVPVLNELGGLKEIMPRVPRHLFEQILVVDGQSKDGSAEWAREQGFEVHVQARKGLRHAYIEGWPLIRGDYVVTFSPDGNCRPEDLPALLDKLAQGYDLVIGSRYLGGTRSEDDDVVTAFGNWMFVKLVNGLFRSKYTDVMNILRGYRKDLFYELDLDRDSSYWVEKCFLTVVGIEPLLSVRAAKKRVRIGETSAFEPKRIYGSRKLQVIRWGGANFAQVLLELVQWEPRTR